MGSEMCIRDRAAAARQIKVVGESAVEERDDLPAGQRAPDHDHQVHHVLLGPLSGAVQSLARALAPHQLWLLIDEWSALPPDLQPLMADLLRRTFFATSGVVVKISAIHGRSRFSASSDSAAPVGLELGADTAASLDLDDFLLFRNDVASTLDFYAALLFRHLSAMVVRADRPQQGAMRGIRGPDGLLERLFDGTQSFHNLVLGAEGVPRDALQIAGLAAGAAHTCLLYTSDAADE